MANVRITDLSAASSVVAGDLFEIEQSGPASKKATIEQVRARILTPRGALVYLSTALTGQNHTTSTAIPFATANATEAYDTDTIHDLVTNPSRLTVPSGVTWVRLSGQVGMANVTADMWATLFMRKNGAAFAGTARATQEFGATTPGLNIASPPLSVSAGDYFELFFQIETDTSVDFAVDTTWFCLDILA